MNCPICNKHQLVVQSLEDSGGSLPDRFCPEVITMPGGKILNHYRENQHYNSVRMIVPPYRIVTQNNVSKISIQSQYKGGNRKYYFKTLLKLPVIHPDTNEKILNRIKLLLVLS